MNISRSTSSTIERGPQRWCSRAEAVRRQTRAALRAALALAALVVGSQIAPPIARAQVSISPYFLVMVDTSGSMSGGTSGGNNSCGQAADRLSDAKCVLQRVVNAYGDVTFGLGRFQQAFSGGTCSTPCRSGACGCTGRTTVCNDTAASGQILVPIAPRNQAQILNWVDYSCGSCTATTGASVELRSGGNTPLEGALLAARDYLQTALVGDPYLGCRPVSVILLTDGAETCGGTPRDGATALWNLTVSGVNVRVRTYPIGFGVTSPNTQINDIANYGAGRPTPAVTGFYATDETTLALAFSQIIADSVRVEVCDGIDNNCNGLIDEGFTLYCNAPSHPAIDLCTDPGEICDRIDNNCDGTTDEGFPLFCDIQGGHPARDLCVDPGEVCNRLDDNCDGTIDEDGMGGDICAGCTPTTEICDGIDNDCDGVIDGITRPCGSTTGVCTIGTQLCTAGVWGTCSGVGPSAEVCDGFDNDCDGVTDGFTRPCGSMVGACTPGAQLCSMAMWGPCIGETGPGTEVCNAIDDDCDGMVDEGDPGGGAACGSSVGVCLPGTRRCMGGAVTCVGGTSGTPEVCNGLDDDCDGLVDQGNPGGGAACGPAAVGACRPGTMTCTMGGLVCVGGVGPETEICNGIDDDCDGMIDEGSPGGGDPCGSDVGACRPGTTVCMSGLITCSGAVGPTPEICNAIDDDCNGIVDDGIAIGAPCGSDIGECSPGSNVCDPATGMVVCRGEIGPTSELCDLLDNDCNGAVDDGLASGGPCGSDVGACMAGTLRCIAGAETCVGEVLPSPEICDCIDNDCDGPSDEPPPVGSLCPAGSTCIDCQCAPPCGVGEFRCPTGRSEYTDPATGMCFCVADACDPMVCVGQTRSSAGGVACAPDHPDVATCVCRGTDCTFACDGVVCVGGQVCDPRDSAGRCVEDSCRGLGCPAGEVCDEATGACSADPCTTTDCPPEEACRLGVCEASCAGVMCSAGELCHAGTCQTDGCAGVTCGSGEVCNPTDGMCAVDLCAGVSCSRSAVCDPTTGACVDDPCLTLHCPAGQSCELGECTTEVVVPDAGVVDAGMDAGGFDAGMNVDPDEHDRVLGAGGCSCDVPGAPTRGRGGPGPLALLLLASLAVWRRRGGAR